VQALALLLRQTPGYEVDIVVDGLRAIQSAAFSPPDVVLLDLGLPWMHGHDVCKQIISRVAPHRPLMVAITGHDGPEVRKKSLEAGFDFFFAKPVDYEELMVVVEKTCATKNLPGA
jgi:CheY-like chemotaxis protein